MRYANLQQLLSRSTSARQYFVSLPVALQLQLHRQNELIHSAHQLHQNVWMTQRLNRLEELSEKKERAGLNPARRSGR